MTYTIVITKIAKKDIDTLEPVVRRRLGKKLQQIALHDDLRTVAKHLVNSPVGEYRLRVGDYRVLFDLIQKEIVILRVQHRKDVYRKR
jgi:mRNA interferase RelE/StbE